MFVHEKSHHDHVPGIELEAPSIDQFMHSVFSRVNTKLSEQPLYSFIAHELLTIHTVGKKLVVFLKDDTDEQSHNRANAEKLFQLLLADSQQKGVVFEYFSPELKRVLRESILYKLVRPALFDVRNKKDFVKNRIFRFSKLSRLTRQAGKQVFVTDIAYEPKFMVFGRQQQLAARLVIPTLITQFALLFGVNFALNQLPGESTSLLHYAIAAVASILAANSTYNQKFENVYRKFRAASEDKDIERIVFDLEDARRVFAAIGIRKIAHAFLDDGGEYITVVSPKAHIDRISERMYKPERWNRKALLYKLQYPYLKYKARHYIATDDVTHDDGWQKQSEIPL